MDIEGLDHIVLTVRDVAATCRFYERVLGAQIVTFGEDRRTAIQLGRNKINLHQAGREFEPRAPQPTPGSGDFCLVTALSLDQVCAHLKREGVPIEVGRGRRAGALGEMESVYFRDPDGNLVEVASYMAS